VTDPILAEMGIGVNALDIKKIQINDPSIAFALGKGIEGTTSTEKSKIKLERSCFVTTKAHGYLKIRREEPSKDTLNFSLMKSAMKEKEISEVIALEKERLITVRF
jgi:hypothetical protein